MLRCFFFFNDTATTEIYTLSLHDALPISLHVAEARHARLDPRAPLDLARQIKADAAEPPVAVNLLGHLLRDEVLLGVRPRVLRSEEHTSELQSRQYLVCRLLLEKKKNNI